MSDVLKTGRRWIVRTVLVLLAAYAIFFVTSCFRVVGQSKLDEARPADAIVIFGAAEYVGHPSPVLKARLDHALMLYRRGLAPMLITTGGSGWDTKYTEGGVGRDYLASKGVPDANLIAETISTSTAQSAERIAVIMRANNMKTCVAVSDPYHMFRIKQMLRANGITVYTSPRPEVRVSMRDDLLGIMREALSYTLWRMHITQVFEL